MRARVFLVLSIRKQAIFLRFTHLTTAIVFTAVQELNKVPKWKRRERTDGIYIFRPRLLGRDGVSILFFMSFCHISHYNVERDQRLKISAG